MAPLFSFRQQSQAFKPRNDHRSIPEMFESALNLNS